GHSAQGWSGAMFPPHKRLSLQECRGYRSCFMTSHSPICGRRFLLAGACLLALLGCQDLSLFRMQSGDDEEKKDALDRVVEKEIAAGERTMIGDYTNISGLKMVVLEGVGLVTQLNGTGGDSPSSNERKAMLDDMRK